MFDTERPKHLEYDRESERVADDGRRRPTTGNDGRQWPMMAD
ncbi:hypothetical protein [Halobiforma nitratireducens]|nr:hypothetical protein [Halobiforma nitratireducens]